MADHYLRKYGEATTIPFELYEVDGVDLRVDAAHASGDTKIMKDEGAEANTSNGFIDEGQGYSIAPDATEMSAARQVIYIVDQTNPKVWLDKVLIIETYSHASAQHVDTIADFVDAQYDEDIVAAHGTADSAGLLLRTLKDWIDGNRLDLLLDAIPTTAMRGTDSAALASVCTSARLSELDAGTGGKMANVMDALDTLTKAAGDGDLAVVKTAADAIKVVTDKFVFTKPNEVDANMQSINGAEIIGDGDETPWDGI